MDRVLRVDEIFARGRAAGRLVEMPDAGTCTPATVSRRRQRIDASSHRRRRDSSSRRSSASRCSGADDAADEERRGRDAEEQADLLARGVAPTRNPVLRSCDVAPATAAATHTTPPIVSASTRYSMPAHPTARNISDVSSSVATVMPEIGFDDVPICPVMRLETVTKRKAKTTREQRADDVDVDLRQRDHRDRAEHDADAHDGHRHVALGARARGAARASSAKSLEAGDERRQIVGSVRRRLIRPAAVTAPAPM